MIMKYLNFIDNTASTMYKYPIKSFIYLLTLNMLYYFVDNFILSLLIFLVWVIMIDSYALSRYIRENGRANSMDVLRVKTFTKEHILALLFSNFSYTIFKALELKTFVLILLFKVIISFIMTYGYIKATYKQMIKE